MPLAEKSLDVPIESQVEPSGPSACSLTDPPPNVASTAALYLPPPSLNGAVVALIIANTAPSDAVGMAVYNATSNPALETEFRARFLLSRRAGTPTTSAFRLNVTLTL